jgi:hypothetical protein
MFEAGNYYHLTYGKLGHTESFTVRCIDWQHPLLKCCDERGGGEKIINIANSSFMEAQITTPPAARPVFDFGSIADTIDKG